MARVVRVRLHDHAATAPRWRRSRRSPPTGANPGSPTAGGLSRWSRWSRRRSTYAPTAAPCSSSTRRTQSRFSVPAASRGAGPRSRACPGARAPLRGSAPRSASRTSGRDVTGSKPVSGGMRRANSTSPTSSRGERASTPPIRAAPSQVVGDVGRLAPTRQRVGQRRPPTRPVEPLPPPGILRVAVQPREAGTQPVGRVSRRVTPTADAAACRPAGTAPRTPPPAKTCQTWRSGGSAAEPRMPSGQPPCRERSQPQQTVSDEIRRGAEELVAALAVEHHLGPEPCAAAMSGSSMMRPGTGSGSCHARR